MIKNYNFNIEALIDLYTVNKYMLCIKLLDLINKKVKNKKYIFHLRIKYKTN